MLNIVILGAGQTGRGFVARLLHTQARLTFIDRDAVLVDALNARGAFTIRYYDDRPDETIDSFTAYIPSDARADEALRTCDAVFISVRGENGLEAGAWLAARLPEGVPVIACENAKLPAAVLGEPLQATAASAAVFCTTTNDGAIDIRSENFPVLYVGGGRLPENIRALEGIEVVDDFSLLMERKIYTYNAASGIIAYLGADLGFTDYAQAANDPRIDTALDVFYEQINQAICREYPVSLEAQAAFAALSKRKFQNRAIVDTVERNAASPLRKLAPDERLIAPARMIVRAGGDPAVLESAIAAALRYAGCEGEAGARATLCDVCKLSPDEPMFTRVLNAFMRR